jgi:DNA-binding NtrC family response regulator
MKQGAVDFLVKPFPLQALDAAVRRALDAVATRKQIARAVDHGAAGSGGTGIIGSSMSIAQVREMASRLAESNATTVLIEGDSGVGKEVVARFIHGQSLRAAKPFLQLNCAALPEHLIESELFGHERGAFTDARSQKTGLFESAEGGSVLLDEIGDLPPSGQAKLLLLLENKTFRRVGGLTESKVDVRVIAATNVDLEARVSQGRFRADLFFRLNVVRIRVPPLRERKEDVLALAAFFVSRYNQEMRRSVKGISSQALDLLAAYHWPGNVRELRNVVERAFILHAGVDEIRPEHLPQALREAAPGPAAPKLAVGGAAEGSMDLEQVEKRLIAEAMEKARGNQSQAARVLGISRDTLRYRLKKHGMA